MDDDVVVHVPGLVDEEGDSAVDALWSIRELLSKLLYVLDEHSFFNGVQQ